MSITDQIIEVFMNLPCFAIQLLRKDGGLVKANETFIRFWRISEKELAKFNLFQDKLSVKKGISSLFKTVVQEKGEIPEDFQFSLDTPNGTLWLNPKIVPLKGDENPLWLIIYRDITREEEHQNASRDYKEKLIKREQATLDGLWDWDLKTNKVYFDQKYYDMAGYDQDEFPHLLEEFQKRVHPDDINDIMEEAARYLKGEQDQFAVEFRFLKKDGTWMWIMGRGVITEWGENLEPVKFTGIHTDITDVKQIQNELKEKSMFLDKIIDSSALSIWISDDQGTAIRTNPACLEFFGAREEEVIGKYNLFKDEVIERNGNIPVIRKVFEEGISQSIIIDYNFSEVGHVQVPGATHKIINSIFTPILNDSGNVTNVIVQTIDLTDIKKAEEELRHNFEKQKLVLNSLPIVFYTTDTSEILRNTWISDQVESITGFTSEEMMGSDMFWTDRIHPEDRDRVLKEYFAVLDKDYIETEYRWKIESGQYKWFQDKIRLIRDKNNIPKEVIGLWIDVDEQKKGNEELKELKNGLEVQVSNKTRELKERISDLQRFHDATIDRELRMKELYDEITELKQKLSEKL